MAQSSLEEAIIDIFSYKERNIMPLFNSLLDHRAEVEKLIKIIQEGNMHNLSQDQLTFYGKCLLKLKSTLSSFSDKEVYYLRDIKDRTL